MNGGWNFDAYQDARDLRDQLAEANRKLNDPYSAVNQQAAAWRKIVDHPVIGRLEILPEGDSFAESVGRRLDEIANELNPPAAKVATHPKDVPADQPWLVRYHSKEYWGFRTRLAHGSSEWYLLIPGPNGLAPAFRGDHEVELIAPLGPVRGLPTVATPADLSPEIIRFAASVARLFAWPTGGRMAEMVGVLEREADALERDLLAEAERDELVEELAKISYDAVDEVVSDGDPSRRVAWEHLKQGKEHHRIIARAILDDPDIKVERVPHES